MKITEGYMPYLGYRTYYRIVGECAPGKRPLLLLHGGPGSTHNYFEVLDVLAEDGRAIISYDQLGCGNSAVPSCPSLWVARTWLDELAELRKHLGLSEVHLLGQSWGGMLAIQYMCDEAPQGVRSLILSSTLASASLWEQEGRRRLTYLPQQMQQAIAAAEANGDYSSAAYQEAEDEYMRRHCFAMPLEEQPECVRRPAVKGRESYVTAWGPNEFSPTGTLAGWEYGDKLPQIKVPTMIFSGTRDLSSPLVAKSMYDAIPNARWELFAYSRHMPFVEEAEKYRKLLSAWLEEQDAK